MRVLPGLRQISQNLNFVPSTQPVLSHDIHRLEQFILSAKKLLVLTGAGFSTESGIPDYRSENVGLYARTDRRPMNYQEFLSSPHARQKYWARNFVGWPNFSSHQPNISHKVLQEWESQGKLSWLVTQNVDALHTKAGNHHVTELHGCLHRVLCLSCGEKSSRHNLQNRFLELNPTWTGQEFDIEHIAPDGDVNLSEEKVKSFKVPECTQCGGALKPDVIFFGDNVPRSTVDFVFQEVERCDSILVVGSSLSVYSGYRFLVKAAEMKKSIGIVNIGQTRADHLAQLKITARCGDILPRIKIQAS